MGYTLTDGECLVRGTAFLRRYSSGGCIVLATHQHGWAYVVGNYETVEQAQEVIKEINTEATCAATCTGSSRVSGNGRADS